MDQSQTALNTVIMWSHLTPNKDVWYKLILSIFKGIWAEDEGEIAHSSIGML